MLKAGYDGRHGRGRDAKLDARLRHAPALDHGEKDEQVPQLYAAANMFFPMDRAGHKRFS
jgi:hypothetical protein